MTERHPNSRKRQLCDEALRLAGVAAAQVDDIVLVGGTTKMPLVQERACAYFGRAARSEMPVTKGLLEKFTFSSRA